MKHIYYLKDLQPLINEVKLIKWVQKTLKGTWYETASLRDLINEYYFEN